MPSPRIATSALSPGQIGGEPRPVPNGGSACGYQPGFALLPSQNGSTCEWSIRIFMHRRYRAGRPLLPHIGRQVQPDAVVSAAGRRIDEHVGQWPAQASREPAVPDPPVTAAPQAHHRYITLSDWEGQGERSPSRRSVLEQPLGHGALEARRTGISVRGCTPMLSVLRQSTRLCPEDAGCSSTARPLSRATTPHGSCNSPSSADEGWILVR
jgi:hypothetical protein